MRVLTGFHAIEEKIRSLEVNDKNNSSLKVLYDKAGPRIKKILQAATSAGVNCQQVETSILNKEVSVLPELARDHRGIVLLIPGDENNVSNVIDVNEIRKHLQLCSQKNPDKKSVVVILDSITDPHNTGAIIRSCDQFACDLVVLPSRRSATDSEIIARSSAGASSWVPMSIVPNLVRVIEILKEDGYWIYGADAGGENLNTVNSSQKIAIIMGSEGSGMSRIVRENCDKIISIPTNGKLDSLNVSVAAGILIYQLSK